MLETITIGSTSALITESSGSYTTSNTTAGTGLQLAPREIPQSVTVVTRQRMDDQQLNSIGEVLNNTSGISSIALDTERVSYYARGFAIDNFMYDGVPTTANAFLPGESLLDTVTYDRVEVVRGATGLLRGVGDPSASINLVRKRPLQDFALTSDFGAGRYDDYRGMLDVSTPLTKAGNIRARVVGAYGNRKSFQNYYQQKRQTFYGVVDIDLTTDTILTLGHEYQKVDPKGASWGGIPLFYSDGSRVDLPRSFSPAARWASWNTTNNTSFARLEHSFANGWNIKADFNSKKTDSAAHVINMGGAPDRATGLGIAALEMDGTLEKRENSLNFMATGPFQLFDREHELVLGGSLSKEKDHSDYTYCFAPDDCPSYVQPPLGSIFTWNGKYLKRPHFDRPTMRTSIKQQGIFAAARFSLADPLKLIIGSRLSQYEVHDNMGTHLKEKNKVSPYVGIIYDINNTYSIYGSYTQIFKPQATNLRNINGTMLSPTKGKNKEIGIKAEYLDGGLNVSFAVFEADLDSVAVADGLNITINSGQQAYRTEDGTKSRGFDIDIQGEITSDWHLYAGVSHFTASDQNDARLNTTIPRTTARLFTTYKFSGNFDKLTIGGGINWQSRWYNEAFNPVHGRVEVAQSSYALASLMLRYELSDNLTLSANANNIFDKKYYTALGFQNGYLYGEPRNFKANLTYKIK